MANNNKRGGGFPSMAPAAGVVRAQQKPEADSSESANRNEPDKYRKFGVVMFIGEGKQTMEEIEAVLAKVRAGAEDGEDEWVDKYAFALHDKDVYTESDDYKNDAGGRSAEKYGIPEGKQVGDPKGVHMHVGFTLKKGMPAKTYVWVANKLGIPHTCVTKIKASRFSGYLNYLTHELETDKYVYDRSIVETNVEDWAKDLDVKKATKKAQKMALTVDYVVEQILDGKITEADFPDDKELQLIRTHHKTKINNALAERRGALQRRQMNGERDMNVMYLCGASSTGKTLAARLFAENDGERTRGKAYNVFVSGGGKDFMDGYAGEEWIVLDDMRGGAFAYSEFLKLADNNTGSSVQSRFYNKVLTARSVVMTNSNPLCDFITQMQNSDGEDHKQVFRRVKTYVGLTVDEYRFYAYDETLVGKENQENQLHEVSKLNGGEVVWLPYRQTGVKVNKGLLTVKRKPDDEMAKTLMSFCD